MQYNDTILNILDDSKLSFSRSDGGIISMRYGDEEYSRVNLYRVFPFRERVKFISVRDGSKKDNDVEKEIGIIRDISKLDPETYELLNHELEIRYFTPEITKINSIHESFDYFYFDVETSSGSTKFTLKDAQRSIYTNSEGQLIINDLGGNRFKIVSVADLDHKSAKMMEQYIL